MKSFLLVDVVQNFLVFPGIYTILGLGKPRGLCVLLYIYIYNYYYYCFYYYYHPKHVSYYSYHYSHWYCHSCPLCIYVRIYIYKYTYVSSVYIYTHHSQSKHVCSWTKWDWSLRTEPDVCPDPKQPVAQNDSESAALLPELFYGADIDP